MLVGNLKPSPNWFKTREKGRIQDKQGVFVSQGWEWFSNYFELYIFYSWWVEIFSKSFNSSQKYAECLAPEKLGKVAYLQFVLQLILNYLQYRLPDRDEATVFHMWCSWLNWNVECVPKHVLSYTMLVFFKACGSTHFEPEQVRGCQVYIYHGFRKNVTSQFTAGQLQFYRIATS